MTQPYESYIPDVPDVLKEIILDVGGYDMLCDYIHLVIEDNPRYRGSFANYFDYVPMDEWVSAAFYWHKIYALGRTSFNEHYWAEASSRIVEIYKSWELLG